MKKMKAKVIIPILVISALITTGILVSSFFVYSANASSEDPNDFLKLQSNGSSEDLLIKLDVCNAIIGYNTTPTNERVSVKLGSNEIIGIPQFSQTTEEGTTVIIPKEVEVIKVVLRTDLQYNLNILTTNGSIFLSVPENVTLGNVHLTTVSGDILTTFLGGNEIHDLNLLTVDGHISAEVIASNIRGNINLGTTTGIISSTFHNNSYLNECQFNILDITGTIYLNIAQHDEMINDVSGTIAIITGNIIIDYFDSTENVSADIGGISLSGLSNTYTSPNHPAEHSYEFGCTVIEGYVLISADDS
ncbi:MAG: exported protein of unknown function [Promethearchaeota archaeon]|nr:MAG: exported protein of unknown function [Candidatus Lokiarchaeota archaeon]